MPRIRVPFGRTFGAGRSTAAGMQSLVNMYGEPAQGEGRTDFVCYGTPARVLFSTLAVGMIRGQITASDVHYVVAGDTLYKINSAGVSTSLGTIEGTNLVDLSYNGNQIEIVAENKSYSFDVPTLTNSEITGGGFEQAISSASVASYSLIAVKDTGRFRWRLTNSATYSALDFATAEAESDNLVALRAVGNEVVLLGTKTTEWWGPTGDAGANAFAKTATAAANIGCASRDTAVLVDSGLTWVGRDGRAGGVSVYRAEGYSPKKISPPEIDNLLEQVADLSTLNAFAYQQRGHLYYVLNNPGELTVAWDIATNQWSYRKSGLWTMGAEPNGGWDAETFAINGTNQIVGASDGNLYKLVADTYIEGSDGIVREATSVQLNHDGKRAFMSRLELDVEAGIGLSSGQGSAPIVMMSMSDDGGSTWSTPRNAGMGAIGEYKWRAVWNACGSYRNRIIKFRVSDPVKTVFLNAYADISIGAH